ncbi:hypothetical protein A3I27_03250 [Candidatus Giovannonibacteria bacterium RIFCSPLOWO2_02_FULL_43_11b]|uniref:FAD-binding FR-type domain-containing protein n=1 Tax=Candidatus Giovannonibacteria bacterium RIFCSPHIGHO2_12_FULL_43_15 TaxID=1798341 RepID=A0A1F5WNW7_9BACT|nr:MAG: hypothetical protein A3B97_01450 [Candidatus Giovannonibacteria bacterium RIFCSPHIGHO2_02_FULL_43_32]OGF77294.1 MAG: hypothetical protein A3F23_00370 [Candidatus Giovannonibacteria bacterium RIFCSPHIGHO2_12_FULL_43_15]OGF78015.1 MAG: hypothetical protein A3A15_01155 [Candidatus Giovannonibacteria bacterium RIFCSPLOWO2_01_FULL_43_60]OGF89738.1 MAG: hypothetical protein A3I27_03250 [Candidatus Giovannonibacteria bacterium RIFCSPLOWO2_02_FULL_43_11b]OGF91740.1 MAG: hypothetical protein A3H
MLHIDNFLNSITMYRLVLYGLAALAFIAIIFGFLGILPYAGNWLLISAITLLAACYFFNYIFSRLFSVPVNIESSFITALILFLIMTPPSAISDLKILVLAGIIAMASKYFIAPFRRHIFNPSAFAATVIFLTGLGGAAWWVGTLTMFPAVLVIGLLVVRKIRRFDLFLPFLGAGLFSTIYFGIINSSNASTLLYLTLISGPILFFGTIMLTEPITTPPRRNLRIIYGVTLGILFGSQLHFGPFYPAPEFILVAGNLFSYFVGFKKKMILTLKSKDKIAKDIYEFVFMPARPISFAPGQYLEWTLSHDNPDSRGVRRYFTIASSPTEQAIKLGIKLNEPPSSFKKKLSKIENGERAFAGQLAGDFILSRDKNKKLAFIAGGIGITPYRSMIKYLIDTNERRDIVLFYAVRAEEEIAYRYLFIEAEAKIGFRTEYVISKIIDAALIEDKLPDWRERTFYISGPEAMVSAFKKMLRVMGVSRMNITTDYFPGFA